ncbi:MAG: type II toxin-antitoxin system RelE/ParE family toxin [Acidobacteria bacterium]|nr:type II toxin-antitoxin system RelE/ParE family toxin [Acidobacteriota bacterium]
MRSGYRILWTDHALEELEKAVEYLQLNFTDAEIARLANAVESTLSHITRNPLMYPETAQAGGIRRAVVLRFNTLYYRVNYDEQIIEVLSFFSNRQDPASLKT